MTRILAPVYRISGRPSSGGGGGGPPPTPPPLPPLEQTQSVTLIVATSGQTVFTMPSTNFVLQVSLNGQEIPPSAYSYLAGTLTYISANYSNIPLDIGDTLYVLYSTIT